MLFIHCRVFAFRSLFQLQQRRGMKAYIQVVGQHSKEGPASLIVHYDNQRYMFNCREGTQRLCVQEKARLAKMSNVFVSRMAWDCLGGLTGMLLTLTDAGVKDIALHGGKNFTHFVAATRHFVYRTSTSVKVHEYNEESKPFKDEHVTVTPVVVYPTIKKKRNYAEFSDSSMEEVLSDSGSNSGSGSESEGKFHGNALRSEKDAQAYRSKVVGMMFTNTSKGQKAPGHTIEAPCSPRSKDEKTAHPLSEEAKKSNNNTNQKEYLMKNLPFTTSDTASITYICQGASVPRKFNKAAAVALGVKPGPLFGQLQKGKDLIMEDGSVVTRDMVCDPEVPGHVFIVVDCPSHAYVDNLTNSKQFDRFFDGSAKVNVMIHNLGPRVIQNERFKAWLAKFGPSVDHIFGSEDICAQTVQYSSHAVGQVKLAKLNEKIFPIPHYSNIPKTNLSDIEGLPPKSFALESMATYDLEPRNGIAYLDRPKFDHTNPELKEIKEINENEEYLEAVKVARTEAEKVDISKRFPGDDVQVITLGTGSSIPAKYRNVSATLIKIPEYGSIMLDAGEGTFGQMMRRFENLNEELRNLKCIFVSHLHADHHLGVIQLIRKWREVSSKTDTLTIVAPFVYKHWLNEYRHVEYFCSKRQINFIQNERLIQGKERNDIIKKSLEVLKKALGIVSIDPIEVIHCRWAYGLSIQHESGWKLVYSGDTRPCNKLIEGGKDATLLIHEATLEDASLDKAIAKRHSTTSEAVDVGKRMNARFTLLNHFSQRYPKLPVLSSEQSNVCFSFDLMSIPIGEIPLLPKYTAAIQLAFKEEEEEKKSNDD